MRAIILSCLLLGACSEERKTEADQNDLTEIGSDIDQPVSCTVQMLESPPIPQSLDELRTAVAETKCIGGAAIASPDSAVSMDGMTLRLGTDISDIQATAIAAGAEVQATFAGNAIVFTDITPPVTDDPTGSTEKSVRRYWLNAANNKLVGFRRCDLYQSKERKVAAGAEYARAVGPPSRIETFAEGMFASSYRAEWSNDSKMRVSGNPNLARLDVGDISSDFNWSNRQTNISLMRELVQREDRSGNSELSRQQLAIENCLSLPELSEIIVPLLEAGALV